MPSGVRVWILLDHRLKIRRSECTAYVIAMSKLHCNKESITSDGLGSACLIINTAYPGNKLGLYFIMMN